MVRNIKRAAGVTLLALAGALALLVNTYGLTGETLHNALTISLAFGASSVLRV